MLKSDFLHYFKPTNSDRRNLKHWIIVINDYPMYKSISGPFWSCLYNKKHLCLTRKLYIILRQVYGTKLEFRRYYSSPRIWKLHVKFLTKWVASCSICQAMQAANTRVKAYAATKMLQITPITSILHTSDGKKHKTLKDQVPWN